MLRDHTQTLLGRKPAELIRAVRVEPRDGYTIWIEFDDGAAGELDLSGSASGVFAAWEDRTVFDRVRIQAEPYRAVTWGDDLDMCETALYMRLTGKTADEVWAPVFVEVGPSDQASGGGRLPVVPLVGRAVAQAREPVERNGQGPAVLQPYTYSATRYFEMACSVAVKERIWADREQHYPMICPSGRVTEMRTGERPETREEQEARLMRLSDEADAGAFDDFREAAIAHLESQAPEGYAFVDGWFVRLDPSLPDHVTIDQVYDGRVIGQQTLPAPYRPVS